MNHCCAGLLCTTISQGQACDTSYYLPADRQSLTWNLGNLTLLTGSTNAKFQNDDYDVKCHKLHSRAVKFASAGLVYNGKCAKGTVWSTGECKTRCDELIK